MKSLKEIKTNFPLGEKIIIIGNEPYPNNPDHLIIGVVTDYEVYPYGAFLVYRDLHSGKEFLSMSLAMYHSEELEIALLKLSWDERWNIAGRGLAIITKKDAKRKIDNYE